jgi:hypothetical protein
LATLAVCQHCANNTCCNNGKPAVMALSQLTARPGSYETERFLKQLNSTSEWIPLRKRKNYSTGRHHNYKCIQASRMTYKNRKQTNKTISKQNR